MSREEFAHEHGADPADLAAVRKFAAAHGLIVALQHAPRRTVVLSGTVEQFSAAFSVQLHRYGADSGATYRGRTGTIQLPTELDGVVEAVLGLDNRPQAKPHFRLRPDSGKKKRAAAAGSVSFTPLQVASLYGFPSGTGEGQCVAIIELGGGYRAADLNAYFNNLNVGSPKCRRCPSTTARTRLRAR
jgi:kumamolisin